MTPAQIINKIGHCPEIIGFNTTPARAFVLIAQLQLALRHPENTGASAVLARQIADNLTEAVCRYIPEARELIEQGWNPACDVTRQYAEAEIFCVFPLEEGQADG